MTCPKFETLQRMALGFLEDETPVRAHAAKCETCGARLASLEGDHAMIASAAKRIALPVIHRPRRSLVAPLAIAAAALLLAVAAMMILSNPFASSGVPAGKSRSATDSRITYANDSYNYYTCEAPACCKTEKMVESQKYEFRVSGKLVKGEPKKEEPRCESDEPRDMFFKDHGVNPEVDTAKENLSTFGLDVDTASYTMTRAYLKRGLLPPKEAVRVEEFLNYFRYRDEPPQGGTFAVHLEAAPSPFNAERHLLRVAIQAKELKETERKDVVLTFIIDVSGSMGIENRLELVKKTLRHLIGRLRPTDRIGIVVYGTNGRKLLDPTPVVERDRIVGIIDDLRTEGCTNLEDGVNIGYALAAKFFDPKSTNRVIICTDGVANNGVVDPDLLVKNVKERMDKGIYLSVFGFGMENHNDALLEKLADTGKGHHAYIDEFAEAKKAFSEGLVGMLEVVAADAKLQVEFDPATVAAFRLLGYEKRHLEHKDFRDDKVDAGQVGAGHHVTALYEITLKPKAQGRIATVHLRYREPDTKEMVESQVSIGAGQVRDSMKEATPSFRLAAAVAAFAEVLRESEYAKGVTLKQVREAAQPAVRDLDAPAEGSELLELIKIADGLRR